MSSFLHLVQWNEICTSKSVFAKKLEASLGSSGRLNDNVIKHTTGSRYGDVVLLGNGCKISKSSQHTDFRKLASFLGGLKDSCYSLRLSTSLCLKGCLRLLGKSLQNKNKRSFVRFYCKSTTSQTEDNAP